MINFMFILTSDVELYLIEISVHFSFLNNFCSFICYKWLINIKEENLSMAPKEQVFVVYVKKAVLSLILDVDLLKWF